MTSPKVSLQQGKPSDHILCYSAAENLQHGDMSTGKILYLSETLGFIVILSLQSKETAIQETSAYIISVSTVEK